MNDTIRNPHVKMFGNNASRLVSAMNSANSGVLNAPWIIGSTCRPAAPVLNVKAFFKTKSAFEMLSALKNTHDILTNINVMIHENALPMILTALGNSFSPIISFIILVTITKIPCITPQRMKVQPAPCQKPLNKKTMNTLIYVRTFPFLFPPKGIYTYLVKKRVSVICHLSQNSVIVTDLYGELKLRGISMLNIFASPIAISQYPEKSK